MQRGDEDRRRARLTTEAIGSHYGREVHGVEIEDTEPDIGGLWPRPDGSVWVRTGRGDRDRPAGVLTTLDVLDAGGRFVRQRRLACPGDPLRDGIHILPDGRLVVVTGAVDAYRREQAITAGEAIGAEEIPLEVVCYAPLEPVAGAAGTQE